MRVCKSRKSMNSVMNHRGFGGITIIKDGFEIYIPQKYITSKGKIKKLAFKKEREEYINKKVV